MTTFYTPLPDNSFLNGNITLNSLGSFWSRWFDDSGKLISLYDAEGIMHYQAYMDLLEAIDALSVHQVPVFKTTQWQYITLKESELNGIAAVPNKYDSSGLTFESNLAITYDGTTLDQAYAFNLDSTLETMPMLYNRVLNPSLVLAAGVDYTYDVVSSNLILYSNPFENSLIPMRKIVDDNGDVVDREIRMWAFNATWDHEYVWKHFGYVVDMQLSSSEYYKMFIGAIWDSLVFGSSIEALQAALTAMSGVPFALEEETVLAIYATDVKNIVETTNNLYECAVASTVLVTVGQQLDKGDNIFDAVTVLEPEDPSVYGTVLRMSLDAGTLGGYGGPVILDNSNVDIEYIGVDPNNGKAIAQFEVRGDVTVVNEFWASVHRKGLESGQTFAEAIDIRNTAVTQPKASDLPELVNPMTFVIDEFMRNNLYIITVKPEYFATGAPGLGVFKWIKKYLPPQTSYMIFVEIQQGIEYYNITANDTVATASGVHVEDLVTGIWSVDKGPAIRTVPENCA